LRFNHGILAELKDKKLLEVVIFKVCVVHEEKRYVFRRLALVPRSHYEIFALFCVIRELHKTLFISDVVPPFTFGAANDHVPATTCQEFLNDRCYFLNGHTRHAAPDKYRIETMYFDFEIGGEDAGVEELSICNLESLSHVVLLASG